ncbi:MAG: hypothetical protein EOP51_16085 [Sphingobacteriales bacterium]|nr:MAG: hypothetical protein EOP51_16085 [Sphingobacteriales bacterium]
MFTYTLLTPNRAKALDYFTNEQLKGWGYFADRIGHSDMLQEGSFHIIGNTDADPEKVDNFGSGWQIFPSDWGEEDVSETRQGYGIVAFTCTRYLAQQGAAVLFEDFMGSPAGEYLQNHDEIKFYVVEDKLEYLLDASADSDTLWKNVAYIGFPSSISLFIKQLDMSELQVRQQLPATTIEQIYENIEAIVWGIYDGDSCAVWIRNGATHVQDLLQQGIDRINKIIAEGGLKDDE